MSRKIEILDCTLRDASYPIKFQFTARDTAVIALALERAGIELIEIGHGLGLGASSRKHGESAETDETYLATVQSVLTKAKFGMFLIPGIADLDHIAMVARHGGSFVRIGTDVTRTEDGEPFIRAALDAGLSAASNLMKTYALPIDGVLRRAERLAKLGVDTISIVDSAGGMFPRDVAQYVEKLKQAVGCRIGFHGHNNLQLAIANALAAVEAGATVIDSTLRGMGRSAGNAQTEVLALALKRLGYETGVDIFRLMDAGDRLISPVARGRGMDSLEMTLGYAMFHSGYLGLAERVAEEAGIDPRRLIMAIGEVERVNVSEALARRLAAEIKAEQCRAAEDSPVPDAIPSAPAPQEERLERKLQSVVAEIYALAAKSGARSAFTIARVPRPTGRGPTFPFMRAGDTIVIGNAEVESAAEAMAIAVALDGKVDYVLVDTDSDLGRDGRISAVLRAALKRSTMLSYSDRAAHVVSTERLVRELLRGKDLATVGLSDLGPFGGSLALRLMQSGWSLRLHDDDPARLERCLTALRTLSADAGPCDALSAPGSGEALDILIGARLREPCIGPELVARIGAKGSIVDAGIGTLTGGAREECERRGHAIYRVDMRAGLFAEAMAALTAHEVAKQIMGRSEIAGATVVAGGVMGRRGNIVVDTIRQPTKVIGVADGNGALLRPEEIAPYREIIAQVESEILRRQLP
jgi:4-hydroxy 2-oxovalerate aldolase/long-chain acyl-CoA synthetase